MNAVITGGAAQKTGASCTLFSNMAVPGGGKKARYTTGMK